MRFDAFLKENDYKAVEAIRKAEQETKAKQVCVRACVCVCVFVTCHAGAHCGDQENLEPDCVGQERHGQVALLGVYGFVVRG